MFVYINRRVHEHGKQNPVRITPLARELTEPGHGLSFIFLVKRQNSL